MLWDAQTGEMLKSYEHQRIVRCCTFTKDDSSIITGGQEKLIRIFDIQKGNDPIITLSGHTSMVKSLSIGENPNILFSSGEEKDVRVWDIRTGSQIHSIQFENQLVSIYVQNNKLIATEGKNISFWGVEE